MNLDENNLWQAIKEVKETLLRASIDIKPVSKEAAHKDLQDALDKMKDDFVKDILGGVR